METMTFGKSMQFTPNHYEISFFSATVFRNYDI